MLKGGMQQHTQFHQLLQASWNHDTEHQLSIVRQILPLVSDLDEQHPEDGKMKQHSEFGE